MQCNMFTHWSRFLMLTLITAMTASCGSGDGPDPIIASPEDVAAGTLALIFEDDFGGPATAATPASKSPLAIDNWRVETGYGPDNDGNGNDEWQLYQNSIDNLYIENGSLVISAQCSTAPACGKRDDSITSARITSQNRLNIKYGTVQARIKMPSGLGMWPAFWMLGSDFPGLAWPDAGEIDIVEMHYFFSDIQTTHFATHWAGPRYAPGEAPVCASGVGALSPDEQENCATSDEPEPKTFDFPLTDDFHIFELEWTDKVIIGKIDGMTYFTQGIDPDTMEEFQKDYFLLLNVAVGGTLGGRDGPTMTAADWADPNQTNMLVDWVRVYKNVPSSTGTLIAESGKNLDFNRIINSAEIGGAFVEALDSTAVEALEGNEVLSLIYSTAVSENGGIQAGFSGAIFDFNRTDLSSFTKVIFSIDFSQFPGFEDIGIEFQDSRYDPGNGIFVGSVQLRTSAYTPITTTGNWNTYEIPLSDFAGVNLNDITAIGFFNPFDSTDTLIAGTLYIDDIRFETEECTTTGSVAFDSINYNPATSVASVSVDDICAASSLAVVKVEAGTDEIVVGVNLDAAGQGETIFNLVKSDSVCSTDDELSLIKLSSPLMATYTRTFVDADGTQRVNTATTLAGIDPSAPGTTIVGEKLFIYATDPAQTLGFLPDTDFSFSDFGTGSQFDGNFTTDATFSPVFSVSNSANSIAVLALFNFTPGFAANAESINFKVKDLPNNFIEVSFGDPKTTFPVNLLTYSGSTSIGDGWFEVSIPMTEFPDVGDNTFVQFTSDNSSPAAFTYLITDIFLQESAGNAPAECDNVILPPVAGSGTGATGATGGPFSVSFDDSAVTYGFIGFGSPDTITALNADPVDGTNMVAVTTKPVGAATFAGVTVETVPGITYPLTATSNQLTIRIYAPGAGLTVLMKLEDSANSGNFAEAQAVTTVDTGWETLTFTFVNPPAFTYDKLSLFFGFGTVGDGTAYTWDTIEFLGTVPPPAGGELLTNGTFEAGDTSGWALVANDGTFSATMDQAASGVWSGNLVASVPGSGGPASFPVASQNNFAVGTVTPGQSVTVSFDICGELTGAGGVVQTALLSEIAGGSASATDPLFGNITPTDTWVNYTMTTLSGTDVTGGLTLQLKSDCGGNPGCTVNAYFDNVSVVLDSDVGNPSNAGGSCAGAPPPPPPPPTGPNLLTNGDFEANATDKAPWINAGGIATNNLYEAVAADGGNVFDTNLSQVLDITGGADYTLTFRAKASVARNMVAGFGDSGPPFGAVTVDVPLTTEWQTFTFPLTATGFGGAASRVLFDMGTVASTVNIDDVSLELVSAPGVNLLTNGDFEANATDKAPWINAGGIATNNFYEVVAADGGNVFDTNLSQVLDITGDTDYILTFIAKASVARNMVAGFGDSGPPFGAVIVDVPLTTEWQSFTFPLTSTGFGGAASRVLFDMGTVASTVNIDDVSLAVVGGGGGGGGEISENPGFESGDFTGWVQFESTPGNQTVNTGMVGDTSSEGSFHAQINNTTTNTNSLIKQERKGLGTVTPGIAWTVTFDARGSLDPVGAVAFAEFFCETAGGNENCGSGGGILGGAGLGVNADPTIWTSFSFSGTAGPNTESLTLQLGATTGGGSFANMFYDNISIFVGP